MDGQLPSREKIHGYRAALEYEGVDGKYDRIPRSAKQGGLKSLVSKFESLSCSTGKANNRERINEEVNGVEKSIEKLKERGWRGAVRLKMKEKETQNDDKSTKSTLENGSEEIKSRVMDDAKRLQIREGSQEENSEKEQNALLVRGKKEGRKWRSGLGMKPDNNGVGISESAGKHSKRDIEGKVQPKVNASPLVSRRESIVQMRIRMLERPEQTKQSCLAAIPNNITLAKLECNESSPEITRTTTKTDASSGGRTRERARLRKAPPQLSSNHSKGSSLQIVAVSTSPSISVSNIVQSASSQGVLIKAPPLNFWMRKPAVIPEPGPETPQVQKRASESDAGIFRCKARSDNETRCKDVAPTIRERIRMFEAAKDNKGAKIVALFGLESSVVRKRRIDGEQQDLKEKQFQVSEQKSIKVANDEEVNVEEPSSKIGRSQSMNVSVSRYLAERKKSRSSTQRSSDGKINGKYASAFAGRRRGKESANAIAPQVIDQRVANIIFMASEIRQPIVFQDVVDDFVETERIGSVARGTREIVLEEERDSSEDDEAVETTLVVQSSVPLSEPKPLRITEVSRMLKMCRLGRGGSKDRGKGENEG